MFDYASPSETMAEAKRLDNSYNTTDTQLRNWCIHNGYFPNCFDSDHCKFPWPQWRAQILRWKAYLAQLSWADKNVWNTELAKQLEKFGAELETYQKRAKDCGITIFDPSQKPKQPGGGFEFGSGLGLGLGIAAAAAVLIMLRKR